MHDLLRIEPRPEEPLEDILFRHGVEFPCAGESNCGGCRIRVVEGEIPVTPEMRDVLTPDEVRAGWRLGCRARASGPVTLEIGQWQVSVLSDESALPWEPVDGLGAAVDVGTTTLVAQILNLATGEVTGVRTGLNPQCRHGADIMSRIRFDMEQPGVLRDLIRRELGAMLADMAAGRELHEVLLAGNSVMHHLFCGLDVEPLSHVPFETETGGQRWFSARELGWDVSGPAHISFLPCLGSFVGSDILAGIVATGMLHSGCLEALVDLGTNGEIVAGGVDGFVCASTAAGPAFEAGRIRMGMLASPGAIDRVVVRDGTWDVHVLGGGLPRGICGSGLVDAAAAALDLGLLLPSGRFAGSGKEWVLAEPVRLAQADVRELQLAKAAIAAGFEILASRFGGSSGQFARIRIGGAFGNYVSIHSARRIGLLPAGVAGAEPCGNTALRGVKMLLLAPSRRQRIIEEVLSRARHISLAADPAFQDRFVEHMGFAA